jgi:hypothetical protein
MSLASNCPSCGGDLAVREFAHDNGMPGFRACCVWCDSMGPWMLTEDSAYDAWSDDAKAKQTAARQDANKAA